MKKCRVWILAGIAFLLMIGICRYLLLGGGSDKDADEKQERTDEQILIGMTFDSFVLERWQRDRDVLTGTARKLGAEVNVQSANGDIQEQIDQIHYFIEKQVDVIILVMVASDESPQDLKTAIAKAQKAGIPVIAYDRLVQDADVDLYISFDNEEVGRLMAEHMKEHLKDKGKVLQICGSMADDNVSQIMEGFSKMLDGSGLSIAQTDYAAGWLGEKGFSSTSEYLNCNTPPDGIMCGNDNIAGNAIRALSEHRLAGSVCVVGQDADLDACQRIVEGTQCMTVYKPVEKLAKRAVELAVKLAKNEAIDVSETINDGSFDVPYEKMTPVAVTKENMDEIITGKYHEESDIYLNVRK